LDSASFVISPLAPVVGGGVLIAGLVLTLIPPTGGGAPGLKLKP